MNLRPFILGTVAANLALVGALLWQTARMPGAALHAGFRPKTQAIITEVVNEPAASVPAPAVTVAGSPPFQWSQVESTNYIVCMTNLLAIGCPKETVRDILEARIADDFRTQLRELTRPFQSRFWDTASASGKLDEPFEGTPQEKSMEELKKEKKRFMGELHAVVGAESKPAKPGRNEQFAHLAGEKQAEVIALEGKHAKERQDMRPELAKATPAERGAKSKEMVQRQTTERRALYTETEWDEAELRRSPQAAKVRAIRGFTATPDELRSLARQLRDFDNSHPRPIPRDPRKLDDDPDYKTKLEEREAQRKEILGSRLGGAGFAAYERGSDPRFDTLLKLSRRLDLQPASAAQWLELQTAAQDQANKTRQSADLSDDARAVALLGIRVETERTLQASVGQRGWSAYQRYAGDWLKQLDK